MLTIDRVVIGISSCRAATLELRGGARIDSNSVRTEKGVHMAFIVLSGEHNRVNVLGHETVYHDSSVCVYCTCAAHEKNGTHFGVQNAKQKQ